MLDINYLHLCPKLTSDVLYDYLGDRIGLDPYMIWWNWKLHECIPSIQALSQNHTDTYKPPLLTHYNLCADVREEGCDHSSIRVDGISVKHLNDRRYDSPFKKYQLIKQRWRLTRQLASSVTPRATILTELHHYCEARDVRHPNLLHNDILRMDYDICSRLGLGEYVETSSLTHILSPIVDRQGVNRQGVNPHFGGPTLRLLSKQYNSFVEDSRVCGDRMNARPLSVMLHDLRICLEALRNPNFNILCTMYDALFVTPLMRLERIDFTYHGHDCLVAFIQIGIKQRDSTRPLWLYISCNITSSRHSRQTYDPLFRIFLSSRPIQSTLAGKSECDMIFEMSEHGVIFNRQLYSTHGLHDPELLMNMRKSIDSNHLCRMLMKK